MKLRYLKNVVTLKLDAARCNGCGTCIEVCPRGVFAGTGKGPVTLQDRDACMECGACARNCACGAVSVRPGVGCAYAILMSRLNRKGGPCDCTLEDYSL